MGREGKGIEVTEGIGLSDMLEFEVWFEIERFETGIFGLSDIYTEGIGLGFEDVENRKHAPLRHPFGQE